MPAESTREAPEERARSVPLRDVVGRDFVERVLVGRVLVAVVLVGTLALLFAALPSAGTPGWDESGHAFAALRMWACVRDGALLDAVREFLRADFYAPLGRAGLALGFAFGDSSWSAPRVVTACVWVLHIALATCLARRLVAREVAHWAALFTALMGASCWIGAQHARTAFLESWSALTLAAGALLYLRAVERARVRDAVFLGFAICAALLVKWTHGLQFAASICASAVLDLAIAGAADRRSLARTFAWSLLPPVLVFSWWFVAPWPGDAGLARAHRELFWEYLTKASSLSGLRVVDLAIVYPLQACISIFACGLQIVGLFLGVVHWRDRSWRICALLALAGLVGFAAYPYRIERFVIPTLFPLWALGGAVGARLVARAAVRRRTGYALIGIAAVLMTTGVGSVAVTYLVRGRPTDEVERTSRVATVRSWRHPFARVRAPAAGSDGVQQALDFAAQHLDGSRRFGWIGGTCTEISIALVRWRLFQQHPERHDLDWDSTSVDWLWSDPGWDEEGMSAWARDFDQLVVLDPPDPRERRARNFERVYPRWAAHMPGWEHTAHRTVRFDLEREHDVDVYQRIP
jgi:hypothetical protein